MIAQVYAPTPQQRVVIDHPGHAFVTACPGSGKTRVMVERARAILPFLSKTQGVLFLSFTESAVSELATRLGHSGLLASPVFPSFIGTFDSFLWQFIIAPFGIPGIAARPRLVPDLHERTIAPHETMQRLPLSCFHASTNQIIPAQAARAGFDHEKDPARTARYVGVARALRMHFRSRGELSYDSVRVVVAERLADTNFASRLGKALCGRFAELIVDETQDCNPSDLAVVEWLRSSGIPTKIICDPYQAIYSFRGGVTDELTSFGATFSNSDRHELSGNFRSSPNICKAIAALRPIGARQMVDEACGEHKNLAIHVHILPYAGSGVHRGIGASYSGLITSFRFSLSECPVVAATIGSAMNAVGLAPPEGGETRTFRLAAAVSEFQNSFDHGNVREAIRRVHELVLEIEGKLADVSYYQHLAASGEDDQLWRPAIVSLLRALRFDPAVDKTADDWHRRAKAILATRLNPGSRTISQLLPRDSHLGRALVEASDQGIPPKTIHAVKGQEFPAICVVTTAQTLGKTLTFLESGNEQQQAEEARKLYVAASRAQKFLLFAVPKSQTGRLATLLRTKGAEVTVLPVLPK